MKMIRITLDEKDKKNICSKIIETKEYLNKEILTLDNQTKTLDQFSENIRIFVYGNTKKVRLGQDYIKVNTLNFNKGAEKNHPCPKPVNLWGFLVRSFRNR